MGTRPLGFPRSQRLKSRTLIGQAFEGGEVVKSFPFITRCVKAALPEAVPTQLMVSVPKRAFKRAVDRNRIKRLIREGLPRSNCLRASKTLPLRPTWPGQEELGPELKRTGRRARGSLDAGQLDR